MIDTDYLELTIKAGDDKFLISTFQTSGVDGLKIKIEKHVDTLKFNLYKNSIYPKNLMKINKSFGKYFDIEKDNLMVIVYPITSKTPSSKHG